MIRRLFGIFWIGLIAVILCPLIILQIISVVFLSQNSLEQYVIPKSYSSVTGLFVEHFAHTPEDSQLFADRLRTTLSPELYSQLFQTVSKEFFRLSKEQPANEKGLALELNPLKIQLTQELPGLVDRLPPCAASDTGVDSLEFRFCKATALMTNQPAESAKKDMIDVIQKQIPPRIMLDKKGYDVMNSMLLLRQYMPFMVAGIIIVGIGILMLIVGISLGRLVHFLGIFILVVGAFMGVIAFSFVRLPAIAPVFQGMTPAQVNLATFLATEILHPMAITAGIFLAVGILTLIGDRFLPRKKI